MVVDPLEFVELVSDSLELATDSLQLVEEAAIYLRFYVGWEELTHRLQTVPLYHGGEISRLTRRTVERLVQVHRIQSVRGDKSSASGDSTLCKD